MHDLHVLLFFLFLSWLLLAQSTLGGGGGGADIKANLASVVNTSFFQAKHGCQSKCGNITVPYPFGIGEGCYISPWFELTCNASSDPPTLILVPEGQPNPFKVFSISQTQVSFAGVGIDLCVEDSDDNVISDWSGNMGLNNSSPYTFSDTANKFTVLGCNAYGVISWSDDQGQQFSTGCSSSCSDISRDYLAGENCTGIGCCQVSIPKGIRYFNGSLNSTSNSSLILSLDPCISMFLAEESYQINRTLLFNPIGNASISGTNLINGSIPVALDFGIGNQSCADAQSSGALLCKDNAFCSNTSRPGNGSGYLCNCNYGYEGNPYLGCTEIDLCNKSGPIINDCDAKATCKNTIPGNFTCKCPSHYLGDGKSCYSILWLELFLGLGFGLLSVLIGGYFIMQRRKLMKLREQFFQQNGGLLMRQKVSSMDGTSAMSSKFFTIEELKKATNNYDENRILGRGGHGVVYKGILPDKRVVAIKKSKVIDESQVEEFINELLILTQVNHRNVVKVLGCCFESEVPQLVYEYIPNGTLFEHIHKTSSWLTLEQRLRLATEAASALSYLHSAASPPIIHRDIKSPNILLDANYVAKVADFGASRLVPLDQTHVATLVQGTFGYLDPEYFQSGQLTEKSDVYSFGVVLAELLTGQKPICPSRSQEERSLATYFIMSMNGKRLFQILEPRLLKEGSLDQLEAFAELAKRCLSLKSEERPSMREAVMELERVRKFKKDPWLSQESHSECEIPRIQEAQVESADYNSTERYTFNCSLTLPVPR